MWRCLIDIVKERGPVVLTRCWKQLKIHGLEVRDYLVYVFREIMNGNIQHTFLRRSYLKKK